MSATVATPPTAPNPPAEPRPLGPPLRERGSVRHDEVRAQRWEVRGIAKVLGGVEVGEAEADGSLVVGGPLLAEELRARGSVEGRGPITVAGRLRVRGSLDARSTVKAGAAALEGPVRVEGELAVDTTLEVRGHLRAPAVRGGVLRIRGTADVPGTVTATSVDLAAEGDSAIGTVRCRDLRLRGPRPNVVRRVLGRDAVVKVDRVEAETARVEGAWVGFLKAREVVLGPDAHVAEVEGRVVRAHPSSRVGPESWSRPPAGLSR